MARGQQRRRRPLILTTLAASLVLASLVLAGCEEQAGRGAQSTPAAGGHTAAETPAGATPTAEVAPGDTEKRRAFAGETLTLVLKEGYEIDAIQKYKGDFEQATGATVKLEVYDEPTAHQKFILDSTSQAGAYDITSVPFWHLPEYQRSGFLEPLDEYWQSKRDPWLDPEAIPAPALKTLSVNGTLYALPHTIIGGMLFHRSDLFKKHGIEPPRSTEEILAAAEQVQQSESSLSAFSGRGAPTFASLGSWLGWTWGYGAKLFDKNMCPHATDPAFKQGMSDLFTLMQDYGPPDAASLTFTQAGEKFSSGNAAMIFDTSGFGGIFANPKLSQVVGKVDFTLPEGPAGNPLQWSYIEGLAISKHSKNKDLAWLFLQWRMSEETTRKEMRDGRFDVPNLNVIQSEEYQDLAREQGVLDYVELLPQSWDNITIEHWPFVPEFAQIGDTFMKPVSSALAGRHSLDAALQTAQTDLEQLVKQAGYCQ